MNPLLGDDAAALIEAAAPDPDPPVRTLGAHAESNGFPYVGPAVGRLCRTLATATGARRVFEFGSGFGYSAAWWAGAPLVEEVVLTDYDGSNLERARDALDDAYAATFRYEQGDAVEAFERHDPGWDIVLLDHEKSRYADAFERVRDALNPGALVVADNAMMGPMTPDDVRAALDGDAPSENAAGVAAYLDAVRDDAAFETSLVPLGEGVAVSAYRPREEER